MKLKTAIEAVNYRFTSGDRFLWNCYGESAVYLNTTNVEDKSIGSIVFESTTADVLEITVEVPGEDLCYRWINPDVYQYYLLESASRNVNPNQAWDDVDYTDLETEEDIIEKLTAIANCEEFDRTVIVPLHLTEQEELSLHRMAHEANVTTNEYVNRILRAAVDKAIAESEVDDAGSIL
jgi:hypothetical protein